MNIKRRVARLEANVGVGKLPNDKCGFLTWDDGDGLAEEKVERRKAELLEEFGTLEGFHAIIVRWDGIQTANREPTSEPMNPG